MKEFIFVLKKLFEFELKYGKNDYLRNQLSRLLRKFFF